MTDAIWSLVLWLIFGGIGVWVVWFATVYVTAIGTASVAERKATAVLPISTFIAGIILTLVVFSLVVFNVIMSVVNIVTLAVNGG